MARQFRNFPPQIGFLRFALTDQVALLLHGSMPRLPFIRERAGGHTCVFSARGVLVPKALAATLASGHAV